MKNQTYQLSAQGIERLEKFKRDVLAGDFEISEDYSEGERVCFNIENNNSIASCFVDSGERAIADAFKQIDRTLKSDIEKKYMSFDSSIFYCPKDDGLALLRTDITTPAQRALESLAKRLNQGSYANA